METSEKFRFNLPSRDGRDIADINVISQNFQKIDAEVPHINEVSPAINNKVSGSSITLNDVSPIEHTLGVTARRINLFNGELEQGTFTLETGVLANSNSRVRSKDYMTLEAGTYTFGTQLTDIRWVIYVYDINGSFLSAESMTAWSDSNVASFTLVGTRKVKFGLSYSTNADITPEQITAPVYVVLGTNVPTEVPYIADLSTVNVITKGKNYFDAEYGLENQTDYLGNNLKEGYYQDGAYFQNADGSIYTSFSYGGSGRAYMKVGVIPKGTYILSGKVKSFEDDFDGRNGLYYGIKDVENNVEWVNGWYAEYYSDTTFPQLFSRTFTNNNDNCELIICMIPANIGATLTMEDICVERIDDVKGATYPANADGTVSGVKSISPEMSLFTDKNGVTLDVAYNADTKLYIDNKFAELQALILNT